MRRAPRDDLGRARARARRASCAATAGATAATRSTSGMAVLFVGVAASSAFQHARDVRLTPGQTATVGGYQSLTSSPRRASSTATAGVERIALGARARRAQGRQHGRAPAHRARLLPVRGAVRLGRARARALRGRGDQRGRDEGRPAARRLDRRSSRTPSTSTRSSTASRSGRPTSRSPSRSGRSSGLIGGLRARRLPGPVPPARLAAGGLDLARRADRLRRRADRAVAGTRRGPRPGAGRLRRARGAGPGPRVARSPRWTSWPR